MKLLARTFLVLLAVMGIASCDDNLVQTDSDSFEKTAWTASDTVQFEIQAMDTIPDYDVFINLRNNKEYAYKNLWLITRMKFPQGKIVTDTLQYAMADARGAFLGSGSDVVENKLTYKRGFRFRESGTYQLSLQQAMRKSGSALPLQELDGVLDVGFTIEKQQQNGNN